MLAQNLIHYKRSHIGGICKESKEEKIDSFFDNLFALICILTCLCIYSNNKNILLDGSSVKQ